MELITVWAALSAGVVVGLVLGAWLQHARDEEETHEVERIEIRAIEEWA